MLKDEYKNLIYKEEEIPSFLKPFMNLKEVLRLKDISYYCGMDYGPKEVYDFKEYYSRYDHSLNTAMMYYKFTKDNKGTIAMFLHDVSTPVFSHVVDIAKGDKIKQEYTESLNNLIISSITGINNLLKENDMNISDLDIKKYTIADNDRPRLCIDRLDATLIDSLLWNKTGNINDVNLILNNLVILKNEDGRDELGFKDLKIGEKFFDYAIVDAYSTSDNKDIYCMNLMAEIIKKGLELKLFTEKDLFKLTEKEFVNILNNSVLSKKFDEFQNILEDEIKYSIIKDDSYYNFSLDTKKRHINPLILHNGKALRLTFVNPEYKKVIGCYESKNTIGYVTNKKIRKL